MTSPSYTQRSLVGVALFGALAAAGGYLLMAIPNVEVFTLLLLVAGYALGVRDGILATLVAAFLYFGLNPQGGLFPPLLMAQVLGLIPTPLIGRWLRGRWEIIPRGWFIPIALVLTFWYDLLTNTAYPLVAGLGLKGIITAISLGAPFAAIHIGSNILIFYLLAPSLLRLVDLRWRAGG